LGPHPDYQRLRIRESRDVLMQHLLSGWFLTLVGWIALTTLWALTRRA
jgi:O-phosphoseryl-tRNA(Cys) synthetase